MENLKCIAFHRHFGMRRSEWRANVFTCVLSRCSVCMWLNALGCGFQYSFSFFSTIRHHNLFYVGETCMKWIFPLHTFAMYSNDRKKQNHSPTKHHIECCLRWILSEFFRKLLSSHLLEHCFVVEWKKYQFLTFKSKTMNGRCSNWKKEKPKHINGHYIRMWRLGNFFLFSIVFINR